MAFLRVGMRVKVVRTPGPEYKPNKKSLGAQVGDIGTVVGTVSHPNPGFNATGSSDLSVLIDRFDKPGMGPSYCFEPILNDGDRACDDAEFIKDLDRMLEKVGEVAV